MNKIYQYDVSVIIVNYNSTKYVMDCLNSIFTQCKGCTYEIIVIDNASPDRGIEIIKQNFDNQKIIYIESLTNKGFGGACNLGLEKANGKYIFFLNPDTILLNDALSIFVTFAEQKECKEIALGCCLLDGNKNPTNSYSSFLTPWNIIRRSLGLGKRLNQEIQLQPFEVDFITGADLFVPTAVIDKVGGFDETFFMYCEDVDIQKRMKEFGVKRLIIPGPQIIHFDGGSYTKKNLRSARRRREYDKGKIIYIKKHYNIITYLLFRILFFFIRIPAYINPHYRFIDNIKYATMLLSKI